MNKNKLDKLLKDLDKELELFREHKISGYFRTFDGLNYCLVNDLMEIDEYLHQVKANNLRLKMQVRRFQGKRLATIFRKYYGQF